jgi:hypothetical protein
MEMEEWDMSNVSEEFVRMELCLGWGLKDLWYNILIREKKWWRLNIISHEKN